MQRIFSVIGLLATGAFLMAAGNAVSPNEPAYDWECSINGAQPTTINGVLKTQDGSIVITGSSLVLAGTNLVCMREP